MTKFFVVYHASTDVLQQMQSSTPAEQKAGMDAWMAWAKECGSAVVDLGMPLANGKSIMPKAVKDSTKEVCGYSILQANSMDAVVKLLQKHPHFQTPGQCSIEVHEALVMPGM